MLCPMLWNRNGTLNVREVGVRSVRFLAVAGLCVAVGALVSGSADPLQGPQVLPRAQRQWLTSWPKSRCLTAHHKQPEQRSRARECRIRPARSKPPRGMRLRSWSSATMGSTEGAGASRITWSTSVASAIPARSRSSWSGRAVRTQRWLRRGRRRPGLVPVRKSGELGLKNSREYAKDPPPQARWRIACIFVDKRHRGQGIARAGLEGALAQIARRRRPRRGDLRSDLRS